MEILHLQAYTVRHKKPKLVGGRISKRQLDSLPNYTCHAFVPASPQNVETIFAGRQSGEVVWWRYQPGGRGENEEQQLLGSHSGPVTCILHHPESFGVSTRSKRFLFTGSADATIKVWDPFKGSVDSEDTGKCIQTIRAPYGHDATVTSLAAHCDTLLSCSCDKTLKVWKPDEGRSELKYPWFVVKQLFLFDYWTTCVWAFPGKIAEDTLGEVYVGDAGGGLTMLRSVVSHSQQTDKMLVERLELVKHHRSFRPLGITRILPVPTLNVVLTLSYDDTVLRSDMTNLETLAKLPNKARPGQRFVDMVWSPADEELILADATGALLVWNSRVDRVECETQAGHRVNMLTVEEMPRGERVVMASTMEGVACFSVTRSLPYKQVMAHEQRVLGVQVYLEPSDALVSTQGPGDAGTEDAAPPAEDLCAVSASCDNTVCLWSVQESLQCTKKLTERERAPEISAFLYIPHERLVVTGHENGSLKVWNLATDKSWRIGAPPHSPAPSALQHTNTVSGIAFATHRYAASGSLEERPHVVTASYDGCVACWEVRQDSHVSPHMQLRWPAHAPHDPPEEQLCVLYDPMKHVYYAGGNDGVVSVWSIRDPRSVGPPIGRLKGPAPGRGREHGAITALALDGNFLFTGGEDERISVWSTAGPRDIEEGRGFRCLRSFSDDGEVNALYVIPDSGELLSCSRAGTVLRWAQRGALNYERRARFDSPHGTELRCLAYSRRPGARESDEVYVGTEDGGILRIRSRDFTAVAPQQAPPPPGAGDGRQASVAGGGAGDDIVEEIDGGGDAAPDAPAAAGVDELGFITPDAVPFAAPPPAADAAAPPPDAASPGAKSIPEEIVVTDA